MATPTSESFQADITGENGPAHQLQAFAACWDRGQSYVRGLRQQLLGCAASVSQDPIYPEMVSIAVASQEVLTWFESIERDLAQLHAIIEQRGDTTQETVH